MTGTDTAGRAAAPLRTVLVGCSFAGLEFLYRTARRRGAFAPGTMTVIDPRAIHSYIPLAHEAASGVRALEALQFDAAAFCGALGAAWVTGALTSLDRTARAVRLADGREVPYDRLILALGSVSDIPEPFARSPAVTAPKYVEDASALRRRLHVLRVSGSSVLRVVVVGGGVSGVEWSAELASGRVDGSRVATTLVGDAPRLLPTFRPGVARHIGHVLSDGGVELLLGRRAVGLSRDHVQLDGGTAVPYDVVVWAGGVRPNPIVAALGLPITATGHVIVNPSLEVAGDASIHAMGDCVRILDGGREWPTTMRAIEAIWQGAALARVLDPEPGQAPRPHRLHRDFYYGISLGRSRAAIVRGPYCFESTFMVGWRRVLEWGYYRRFTSLARRLRRRRGSAAVISATGERGP